MSRVTMTAMIFSCKQKSEEISLAQILSALLPCTFAARDDHERCQYRLTSRGLGSPLTFSSRSQRISLASCRMSSL